jgi:hypothetical protein
MSQVIPFIVGSLAFGLALEAFVPLLTDKTFSLIEALGAGAAWGLLFFATTVVMDRFRSHRRN